MAAAEGYTEAEAEAAPAPTGSDERALGESLISAARKGNVELLKQLLSDGAAIGHRDESGWTPLTWASSSGHQEHTAGRHAELFR